MANEEDREQKNSIFGSVPPEMSVSREDSLKRDFGLDIPVQAVPLPSRGLIYPPNHPLHNKESVDIRAMTTREEDILMSRALIRKGTVISELIKSCLIDDVDVSSLVGGDRNALMVAIRSLGYGSEYTGSVDCPEAACKAKNQITVNLNELEIKDLTQDPVTPGENVFRFVLPFGKQEVLFKLLTGKEEEEIMAMMEAKKKRGIQNDNVITSRLLYSIVAINRVVDRAQLSKFIGLMPARDSNALRQHMDKIEPGINMRFNFKCESCGHEEVMPLPLGPTFFWPNAG